MSDLHMASSRNELSPLMKARSPFGGHWSAAQVLATLAPLLTAERWDKIKQVAERRTYHIAPILENIYDRGNTSAVLRTAEAMGFHGIHIIETGSRFKAANRVTAGADKWLDVERWTTTKDCLVDLKRRGYQVLATSLEASVPISEINFDRPTAIILGNEKDGVSRDAIEYSDRAVHIPMAGFVQSFNISVAGAISLYHAQREAQKAGVLSLDHRSQEQVFAELVWNSTTHPEAVMRARNPED